MKTINREQSRHIDISSSLGYIGSVLTTEDWASYDASRSRDRAYETDDKEKATYYYVRTSSVKTYGWHWRRHGFESEGGAKFRREAGS
jgi:hypothetical protein